MRIAIYHNLPSGGAKRAVYEWVSRLANHHTIDVFSLSTADHEYCDIRPFVNEYNIFKFSTRRLFKSPFGRLNAFQRWRDLKDLKALNHQIAMRINSGNYDILFTHSCLFTFIPSLLESVNVPSVYYLHEPFGPGFIRNFERPYLSKSPWRKFLNHLDPFILLYQHRLNSLQSHSILKTSVLLANSEFTRNCMRTIFGVDAFLCPSGVNTNDFRPIPDSIPENMVISVGEMSPRKGFDFIVNSLGKIHQEIRPALILVCNMINNDELFFIKELANRNNVNLKVLAHLNTDELRNLYNQAQLCVYAPVLEPLGLVPLEAMACSKPVVGVREGGVAETIVHENTGFLVDRDPEKFGEAIRILLENPALVRSYGDNARLHVLKNWSWEISVRKLEDYFDDVVSQKRNAHGRFK